MAGSTALPASHRIDQVDALRAFAMTAVILQHCKLLPSGWVGVWLFYVISGFVVTSSLLARSDPGSGSGAELGGFYLRRAARILPIYWGFSLVCFCVAVATDAHAWQPFMSLVFFYNNFAEAFGRGSFGEGAFGAGHLWTISVEMQFYLLYGIAFFRLGRRQLNALLVIFVIAAPLLRLLLSLLLARHGMDPLAAAYAIYTFSVAHFDSFAAGALLALHAPLLTQTRARRLLLAGLAALAIYCAVYVAMNVFVRGDHGLEAFRNVISGILFGQYREVILYSVLALTFAGVVACAVTGAVAGRLLASPLLKYVGQVSYGGYVYHPLGIGVGMLAAGLAARYGPLSGHLMTDLVTFLVAWPLTIAIAALSYRFVETPIMKGVGRRMRRSFQPA
jgi:peptidoglycan/LPS O-acetylase OafA/YrhL